MDNVSSDLNYDRIREIIANRYNQPKQEKHSAEATTTIESTPLTIATTVQAVTNQRGFSVKAIKIVAFIILINVTIASTYYSYVWFQGKQPTFLAMLLSVTMTMAATVLTDVGFMFIKKGKASILTGALLIVLGLTTSVFSMNCTIGGLYDKRSKELATVTKSEVAISSAIVNTELSKKSIERLEALVKEASEEIASMQHEAYNIAAKEEKTQTDYARSNTLEARIKIRKSERAGYLAKIEEEESMLSSLAATESGAAVQRNDYYSFLGGIVHKSPDTMEFVLSAFPAVFIDILGPAMLAVVLFL